MTDKQKLPRVITRQIKTALKYNNKRDYIKASHYLQSANSKINKLLFTL